jgi:hypothetical protein
MAQMPSNTEETKKALAMISEFAISMCADPEYKGSNTTASASAKAKAEVSKLIKTLADAKVEVGADVKKESFQGILQKDLLEATKNASSCRLSIYNDLKDRVLPKRQENGQIPSPVLKPSAANSDAGSKSEKTAGANALSYAPAVQLGMSKENFLAKNNQKLTWDVSTDSSPKEYTKINTRLGEFSLATTVFFDKNKLVVAKTDLTFSSEKYRSEKNNGELMGTSRSSGLTLEIYERSCAKLRDEAFTALTGKQSTVAGTLKENLVDEKFDLELVIKDRPLNINSALRKYRSVKFESTSNFVEVSYVWVDKRQYYNYGRKGSGDLMFTEFVENNICTLSLHSKM